MSKQPRDDSNNVIPVLGFKSSGGSNLTISAVSNRSAELGASTRVISIFCTVDCFFEVGDVSVVADANSHFLPAGIYLDVSLGSNLVSTENNKYIAVVGTSGTLYISERI